MCIPGVFQTQAHQSAIRDCRSMQTSAPAEQRVAVHRACGDVREKRASIAIRLAL